MDVALISDSHIPSREHEIPPSFRERIEVADHVIHAGDFDSKGALADIRHMATGLTAVSGNIDPQIGLPERATVELGGVTFVVTHGTGSPRGWADRVAAAVRDEDDSSAVGVAGHTHELTDTVYEGVRLLNPGSVTGASPASRPTMLTATVEDGTLDVHQYEL
ncbi:metallophosphoesterase family protein [Haloarcula hispanica]|uniref:Phosphoesterase n=1 Tax=Haloarcula hispanica TaxID=51589 RepID=A0A482T2E3_HALHI|nr:metallophosphoesterase family protein [Haloarcula hispanica]MCJ0620152.1 metallophosphoesterase family protein [Haloarcula hispanica]RYJ10578.1 metallophosphoesterase [Haloarcula hispanica]